MIALLWIVWLTGCWTPLTANRSADAQVPLTRLETGQASRLPGTEMRFRLYTDAGRFSSAYGRIHAATLPPPETPTVNFARWWVLGAFLGQRPTAGYGIDLGPAAVTRVGGESILVVQVRAAAPPAGVPVAQVMTAPFVLYKLPVGEWRRIRFLDDNAVVLGEIQIER